MADQSLCTIPGCDKPAKKRGMCNPHYNSWYRENVKAKDARNCGVPGCDQSLHAHGYCARHASKFKKYGDPLAGRTTARTGEPQRWIRDHADYQGDDCIRWPFEVTRYGYGTVLHNGQKRVASRVMCEEAHGLPPSPDMDAAHSCGNGHQACMNPNHLSWKTRKGNVADAIDHGTWKRGSNDRNAKLTDDDVRRIRQMAKTMMQKDIAQRFGIRPQHVSRIVNGERWAWLDHGTDIQRRRGQVGDDDPRPDAGGI